MKKHTMKISNAIDLANWKRVKLTHLPNNTTNATIPPYIFKRECEEYDAGVLKHEHDTYLGERYA